ncbi:MAG: ATP-binding protein [Burkholderiaceae bacterium]
MTLPTALLPVLALATLAAFGAACAVAGALWARARAAAALQRALADRSALLALAESWIWETDAQHRLTLWRAPAQRPGHAEAAWQAAPAPGATLPAIASPGPASGPMSAAPAGSPAGGPLARRMDAHAPLAEQRVLLALDGAADARLAWTLRGEPRFDAAGRFAGYVGSARPVGDGAAGAFAAAALARLLPHLDDAVLLLRRPEPGAPWRLVAEGRGDEASGALAGVEAAVQAGATPDLDWAATCARLPQDVAAALARLPAGETRLVGEWRVSWTTVPAADDPEAGRLVVLRRAPPAAAPATPPAPVPAPVQEPAPAADAGDQESFIYSVSHDLRAPIRVVEGFARILKEDYGRFLDRIGNDHVDRILAAAARMNSMIDALLALSRLQSQPLKRQPVDLSQLARYVVDDLRGNEPDREADIHIEPGLVVHGDPTLIRIAVENLVGNAWKYSAQAPRTRIELRRADVNGQPAFVVADAGAGFDMRFADRLFGVFQRLHSAKDFQGTGVGLASVRRIVRRHGGDIWAESEVGKGARFYFTLPS